jgi:hypothetical protein
MILKSLQISKYFVEAKNITIIVLHKINKLQLIKKLKLHVRNVGSKKATAASFTPPTPPPNGPRG